MTIETSLKQVKELIQKHQFEDAESLLLTLNQEAPEHVEVLHQLSFLSAQKEDFKQAQKYLEKAIHLSPKEAIFYNHLGNVYRAQDKIDEATACYQNALLLQPNYAEAHNNYGLLFYLQQQYEKAEEQFTLALQINSEYLDALFNLALALNAQDKKEDTIAGLMAIIEVCPKHIRAHFLLGKLLTEKSLYKEAEEHFQFIATLQPNNIDILSNILYCLLKNNRAKEAKKYCKKIITLNPKNIEMLYNFAVVETRLGNQSEAMNYYHTILQIEPLYFPALNNLAILYLQQQNLEAAKCYFQQALNLHPDDQAIQYTLRAISGCAQDNQAPKEYIKNLFDQYADHFDQHIENALDYRVPHELEKRVHKYLKKMNRDLEVLDLGCGTGLCGALFKPYAKRLVGVDLSEKMIDVARNKNCYDDLIDDDDVSYLKQHVDAFDLILAADVFIYQGDLTETFFACYQALKNGGLVAFSVEKGDGNAYTLQASGRFAHSKSYIKELAQKTGFNVLEIREGVTRSQYGQMLKGYYVILERT